MKVRIKVTRTASTKRRPKVARTKPRPARKVAASRKASARRQTRVMRWPAPLHGLEAMIIHVLDHAKTVDQQQALGGCMLDHGLRVMTHVLRKGMAVIVQDGPLEQLLTTVHRHAAATQQPPEAILAALLAKLPPLDADERTLN